MPFISNSNPELEPSRRPPCDWGYFRHMLYMEDGYIEVRFCHRCVKSSININNSLIFHLFVMCLPDFCREEITLSARYCKKSSILTAEWCPQLPSSSLRGHFHRSQLIKGEFTKSAMDLPIQNVSQQPLANLCFIFSFGPIQ